MVEVLDRFGKPCAPGESGRLVWTSTVCRGTPFLRYEVEDWGAFDQSHQEESGIAALASIDGRSAGIWELPNGKRINNLYWNHLFKDFGEVRQFQVVIRTDGGLRFLLRGKPWAPEREAHFRRTYTNFLGDVPAEVHWVEQIPCTSRGKRMQVVRES
jgi:phenylacetate-CoA ligase